MTDAINVKWAIAITNNGHEIGARIMATAWDIHSKLAAIKAAIPAGWDADAYPLVYAWVTPID